MSTTITLNSICIPLCTQFVCAAMYYTHTLSSTNKTFSSLNNYEVLIAHRTNTDFNDVVVIFEKLTKFEGEKQTILFQYAHMGPHWISLLLIFLGAPLT